MKYLIILSIFGLSLYTHADSHENKSKVCAINDSDSITFNSKKRVFLASIAAKIFWGSVALVNRNKLMPIPLYAYKISTLESLENREKIIQKMLVARQKRLVNMAMIGGLNLNDRNHSTRGILDVVGFSSATSFKTMCGCLKKIECEMLAFTRPLKDVETDQQFFGLIHIWQQ